MAREGEPGVGRSQCPTSLEGRWQCRISETQARESRRKFGIDFRSLHRGRRRAAKSTGEAAAKVISDVEEGLTGETAVAKILSLKGEGERRTHAPKLWSAYLSNLLNRTKGKYLPQHYAGVKFKFPYPYFRENEQSTRGWYLQRITP